MVLRLTGVILVVLTMVSTMAVVPVYGQSWKIVAVNDLGMHCMDADYRVFSILPPYNVIHAQVIDDTGSLVSDPVGLIVTYKSIADPDGSITTTSIGKTNFWDYILGLFGISLAEDEGLAGKDMPGPSNTPKVMDFEPAHNWFSADGIPITPIDDNGRRNFYPLMRVSVRTTSGVLLASTDIVVPVSDEMTCIACHGSGTNPDAAPATGWEWAVDAEQDYRLNILRSHDDRFIDQQLYQEALAANNYNADGLYATATGDHRSILCSQCHGSNALPGTGYEGIKQMNQAIHGRHATVIDPLTGMPLDDVANRTSCFRCHPGSSTQCLRGAMGNSVDADGSLAMQCQSCHGQMADVASPERQGWFDEPNCQSCHTGTARSNNGQIRYLSVFNDDGSVREAVNHTFATNPDTPIIGSSLYRFSMGHGNLTCEACHGSTHAVFPSRERNDNLQSIVHQGHEGMLVECTSCHTSVPTTISGGPHGMHPVEDSWISQHKSAAKSNPQLCQDCHGIDSRGTELSRMQADRVRANRTLWRGYQVGCYTCHNGPNGGDDNDDAPLVPAMTSLATSMGQSIAYTLTATDQNGDPLTFRIISQPDNGFVALQGDAVTYFPNTGFSGIDEFTYAAWDGMKNSNLGHIAITVAGTDCDLLDRTVWALPPDVSDLMVQPVSSGNITWTEPENPGAIQLKYDVIRSSNPANFSSGVCLSANTPNLVANDATVPPAVYYYLVRTTNGCGDTLGTDSEGTFRSGTDCP